MALGAQAFVVVYEQEGDFCVKAVVSGARYPLTNAGTSIASVLILPSTWCYREVYLSDRICLTLRDKMHQCYAHEAVLIILMQNAVK